MKKPIAVPAVMTPNVIASEQYLELWVKRLLRFNPRADRCDLEDAVLHAQYVVCLKLVRGANVTSVEKLFQTCAMRKYIDILRKNKRRRTVPLIDVGVVDRKSKDPEKDAERREQIAIIKSHLSELPPALQEVIKLRIDGLTPTATAKKLGISRATVNRKVELAKKALKEKISGVDLQQQNGSKTKPLSLST